MDRSLAHSRALRADGTDLSPKPLGRAFGNGESGSFDRLAAGVAMQEKAGIRVVESWEFVTGYCWKQHPSAFAVVQDGVEQPGLAGAEEAGQQGDG
jgi:hypothetical protein